MRAKIAISCFLGGFVGALVALQLSFYFWWIGMVVGALVGYLSFEWREVLRAISSARRKTFHWRPDFIFWKVYALSFAGLVLFFCSWVLAGFLSLGFLILLLGREEGWPSVTALIVSEALLVLVMFFCAFATTSGAGGKSFSSKRRAVSSIRHNARVFWHSSAFHVFVRHLPKLLWRLSRQAPKAPNLVRIVWEFIVDVAALLVWPFVRHVFVQIHSDIRLLCALDSALGAGIGFFAGSALWGGVAGAVIGVLNYEIVSRLILKLAPAKAEA